MALVIKKKGSTVTDTATGKTSGSVGGIVPTTDKNVGTPAQSTPSGYKQAGAGSQANAQTEGMSAADQAALKAAGDAWTNATTKAEQDAAHAQAEAIRNKYGYSGGQDGSARVDPVTGQALGSSTNNNAVNSGYRPSYADDYAKYDAADKSGVGNAYASTSGVRPSDYQALVQHGENYNMYAAQLEQALASATTEEERARAKAHYQPLMDAEHAAAEKIRNTYGYSGGQDGSEYLPHMSGNRYEIPVAGGAAQGGQVGGAEYGGLPDAPELPATPDFQSMLDQWLEAAQTQQEAKIDYATQQGITELERAEADAQAQFQTQRDQVAIDEANALDNQALYAERRGDKGGIGAVQYAAVQNAAMENRRAVNDAQVKLSTDTARQIADLRARGEFEKADALLDLAQTYLSKLVETTQWSAEYDLSKAQLEEAIREWEAGYGLDVAKFNESIRQWQLSFNQSILQWEQEYQSGLQQWEAEFGLAESDITGIYNGLPTIGATQTINKNMAEAGWAMLEAGIKPSSSQLQAMGISASQAQEFLTALKLQQSSGGGGGGGYPIDSDEPVKKEPDVKIHPLDWLAYHEVSASEAAGVLEGKGYSDDYAWQLAEQYAEMLEAEGAGDSEAIKEQKEAQAMYGSSFTQALAWANTMLANKVSDEEIEKRLSQFSSSSLNAAGKLAIMQFIKSKRSGV